MAQLKSPTTIDSNDVANATSNVDSYLTYSSINPASQPTILLVSGVEGNYTFNSSPTDQGASYNHSYAAPGEWVKTTPGTYYWTCPEGVSSISIVCVGGGGGGDYRAFSSFSTTRGGGGGGLAWTNNVAVVPGITYTVVVGSGGTGGTSPFPSAGDGGDSYFANSSICLAEGGTRGYSSGGQGGSYYGDGGGEGSPQRSGSTYAGGGGGAGGYNGDSPSFGDPPASSGAGGVGGINVKDSPTDVYGIGGRGGGVGIYGKGTSGVKGNDGPAFHPSYSTATSPGTAGSGGSGNSYGGGGGGESASSVYPSPSAADSGGGGAVRIIWGLGRYFPETNTAASYSTTIY